MYVRFKYPIRLLPLITYPATQPVNNIPAVRPYKGRSFQLTDKWIEECRRINSAQAFNYLMKPKSGWVNAWTDAGRPISESLSMGGNIAKVLEQQGDALLLNALRPGDPWPDVADHLLVHRFTCWNYWKSQPALPGIGLDVFYPFLINGDAWVHISQVDVFDTLPPVYWPGKLPFMYEAVVLAGAVVRQAPDAGANKIEKIHMPRPVQVYQELNGWAKIGDKRWVELGYIKR